MSLVGLKRNSESLSVPQCYGANIVSTAVTVCWATQKSEAALRNRPADSGKWELTRVLFPAERNVFHNDESFGYFRYLCTQTRSAFITYVCFPTRIIDSWYLRLNFGWGKEVDLKIVSSRVNQTVRKKKKNHIDFFMTPMQIKQIWSWPTLKLCLSRALTYSFVVPAFLPFKIGCPSDANKQQWSLRQA